MRFLYTIILYLGLPLIVIRLCWRARRAPAYAQRWGERFGWFKAPGFSGPAIWVHAVSVGETLAALPMIKALQHAYPDTPLVVTTTTPTGSERVRAALGDSVFHVYMPYDLPDCIARFLRRVQPQLLIIMETELWPNTLAACHRRGIPVVLANARLSEKSARGYRRFAALTTPMLRQIATVAAQHRDDADRFLALGLPPAQCRVTGNIKFDLTLDEGLKTAAAELKSDWNGQGRRLVWLAASTHEGEDEEILSAFSLIKQRLPDLLLVLVPRHPERFKAVEALCKSRNFRVQKRSGREPVSIETDILVGDTMGELLLFYGACDMAFVGGSLVATGGHNLIEPAAWGVPVLSGPHLFNFAEVSKLLQTANALVIAHSADRLAGAVIELACDVDKRREMGEAARAVAEANRGALERLMQIIGKVGYLTSSVG